MEASFKSQSPNLGRDGQSLGEPLYLHVCFLFYSPQELSFTYIY